MPAMLPQRGVLCTRALDMREIDAIGYDMDYTLIDYKMVLLEERVYHYSKEHPRSKGFLVSGMQFDHEPSFVASSSIRSSVTCSRRTGSATCVAQCTARGS